MNKVYLIGNLTRDIELRMSSGGKPYARFSIGQTDSNNKPQFFSCVAFDKTAQLMANFLKKGSKVLVDGHLTVSTKETENGKISEISVTADRVEFLDSRKKEEKEEAPAQTLDISPDSLPFY